jgi:hypothetical protein
MTTLRVLDERNIMEVIPGSKLFISGYIFRLFTPLIRSVDPPKPLTHRLGWLFYNLLITE